MLKSECITTSKASKIKVEENNKSAVFLNPEKHLFHKIRIDGCVITKGKRADYLVQKEKVGQVIVELKGKNILHAADQIKATLHHIQPHTQEYRKIAGLIVCHQVPSGANTQLQKRKVEYFKAYQMHLHAVAQNEEYVFENVFTATPLKK